MKNMKILAIALLFPFLNFAQNGGSMDKGRIDLNLGLSGYVYDFGAPFGINVSADFGLLPMLSLGAEVGTAFGSNRFGAYTLFRPMFHYGAFFLPAEMDLYAGLDFGPAFYSYGNHDDFDHHHDHYKSVGFLVNGLAGFKYFFSNIGVYAELAAGNGFERLTAGVVFKLK